jgi:HopA1 effector protein family
MPLREPPGRVAARAMVARTRIEGPRRALVDGHPAEPVAGGGARPSHVEGLRQALYLACYAGLPWPRRELPPRSDELVAALACANAGDDTWEGGWRFVRWAGQGSAVASRGGALRAWPHGSWLRADGGLGPVADGTPIRLLHVAVPRPRVPGFWFASGWGGPDPSLRVLRTYLGAGPRTAAPLVAQLTGRLHELEVPFTFKIADREALLARRDSAVLYTEARHFRVVSAVVREAASVLPQPLSGERPPFTKPLLPGVSVAEDGGEGASFGEERCALVAEALYAAHDRGCEDDDARLAEVERAFAAAGLDLERPWLAAHDHPDPYELAA